MTFRPLPVMTILALIGLAILIWLGSWQWARYGEKLAMPEEIAESRFVELTGEAVNTPLQYVYTTYKGEALWRSFQLVDGCLSDAEQSSSCEGPVFVDVALLSALRPDEVGLMDVTTTYEAATFVVAENREKSMMGASNQPDKGQWYNANAIAMANALGLENAEAARLLEPAQIRIVRRAPDGEERNQRIENPFANPAKIDDLPPARHLGYALTWFGLAATLIGVYLAFHIARGRLSFRRRKPD